MELKSPEKEKIIDREEVLDKIEKATNEEYETIWDNGGRIAIQKKKSNVKKGLRSKNSGGQFELRVRKDLEKKGWIVTKWSNNFDLEEKKIIPAKRIFNPFSKIMTIGTGFPDFIAFQILSDGKYKLIGVEVKINGTLNKEEKEKCEEYLNGKTFGEILIAKKVKEKNKIRVEYINVEETLGRMRK